MTKKKKTPTPPKAYGVPVWPTGVALLDQALGCGGYPRGRIVAITGPAGSGKTTLALLAAAGCQRAGGTVTFVDTHLVLDEQKLQYASKLGVDTSQMTVEQPEDSEHARAEVEAQTSNHHNDLVIVDSLADLVPHDESDPVLRALCMSRYLRRLAAVTYRTGAVVLFVVQIARPPRTGLLTNTAPVPPPGGQAIKFYASVIVEVRRTGPRAALAKVIKNKCGEPFGEAPFALGDSATESQETESNS